MRVAIFTALLIPAFAMAQSSSTTVSGVTSAESGAITTCISSCSSQGAAAAGCSSYADLACICNSAVFTSTATACLKANCTSTEQTTALGLDNTLCAAYVTTSGSSSATATGSVASATTAVANITSSAGAALSSITSSAVAAFTSLTSAVVANASSAAASATKSSAAGSNTQFPSFQVLTAVAGALMATVVGPIVLFA